MIDVGVLLTRSADLNPVFRDVGLASALVAKPGSINENDAIPIILRELAARGED